MSEFDLEAARRLPLADAALRLLDYALRDDFLDGVFDRHRGRSYTADLRFPVFVRLVADALLGHRGSAHQTFRRAQDAGALGETVQAVYGKLRRVPLGLSQGLFAEAAARLAAVGTPAGGAPPAALAAFRPLALDGKKLKYVAKRLKPLRGLKGHVFGGKLLVCQDIGTGQAVAVEAAADGEAADNPLVAGAVARARAAADPRPRLWVADRAFCESATLGRFADGADQFVVRYHKRCGFHPDPAAPARSGLDADGRPCREDWGWLGKPDNPNRVRVRRLTVDRPGADPLVLVTSLADAAAPAAAVLALYRRRWGIEALFQRVVQVFDVRHLIGATPGATVFQAVLCLLLYNATLVVRDYVAAGANRTGEQASVRLIFEELVRDLTAWMQVIGPGATADVLRAEALTGPAAPRAYLTRTLGGVWTDRWAKAATTRRGPRKPPRAYLRGGHSSVHKILRGEHREVPVVPRNRKPKPTPTAQDV